MDMASDRRYDFRAKIGQTVVLPVRIFKRIGKASHWNEAVPSSPRTGGLGEYGPNHSAPQTL